MNTSCADSVRILIVDDNPTNLKVLSEAIRLRGWKTLVATDGESALEQAVYALPDLILLDVMMPGMDGFETCQHLKAKAETQGIPVIFMTALSDPVDKIRGLELGAVDYITKPFQQEEVLARVNTQLQMYRLTQTLVVQNTLLSDKIAQQAATEAQLLQATQQLENRVQERTQALSNSIQELQTAQLQVIQSEKMSTLGQLLAGVGHEINNPIGFITGNLSYANTYVNDALKLLALYREQFPDPGDAIEELSEEIDVDYLNQDLPKVINSLQDGANRIREISASLRTLARSDIALKVSFNIHEGLSSTLMLLRHRTKANSERPEIKVVNEAINLPEIHCYPGQINQVLMNLLANAIDALDERSAKAVLHGEAPPDNQITIQSQVMTESRQIAITIQDNGLGVPLALQQQIFEQNFTTKPVGQGTGLGLAISRQIVEERHGGELRCISEIGLGSQFVIVLPIDG